MNSYEIMLSESQERMLIVLENGKEAEAKNIFDKWSIFDNKGFSYRKSNIFYAIISSTSI